MGTLMEHVLNLVQLALSNMMIMEWLMTQSPCDVSIAFGQEFEVIWFLLTFKPVLYSWVYIINCVYVDLKQFDDAVMGVTSL